VDILEIIKGRRSVRSFTDRELEEHQVAALKEALIWAPSSGNLQSRAFYFVRNADVRRAISEAALSQRFIADAPLVVVACADARIAERYGHRGLELYVVEDVACSVQNMMLTAHALGLGSTWVGAFDERGVAKALSLPPNLRPMAVVPVGWPARVPGAPARVSVDEAVVEVD